MAPSQDHQPVTPVLTAKLSNGRVVFVGTLITAAAIAWMTRHVYQLVYPHLLSKGALSLIWAVTFATIAWTGLLASIERPKRTVRRQNVQLNRLRVIVLIPAYNEEPALLKECIASVLRQSRKADYIEVVDDGSKHDYAEVKQWLTTLPFTGTRLTWTRTPNRGKRHAQAIGIKHQPEADIYMTLDSDSVLDPHAIEEGLKPFANPKITAVAGICLPINVKDNLLTRFSGLWEMVWQLTERSAQSAIGCVTVNSGILAFYRGDIIRRNMRSYLTETFFGRPVKYSDDSLMTLYCLVEGRTVQQPSCIAFSAIPNRTSHYIRRYIRWMRGSFIRTMWRFKYLPMTSYIYWWHLWRWVQFGLSTAAIIYLTYTGVVRRPEILAYMVGITIVMAYTQSLRYFIIRRSDESFGSQFLTWSTAPVAAFWSITALRVIKWYAYLTVRNNGWGTRKGQPELSVIN